MAMEIVKNKTCEQFIFNETFIDNRGNQRDWIGKFHVCIAITPFDHNYCCSAKNCCLGCLLLFDHKIFDFFHLKYNNSEKSALMEKKLS